jgi:hypothetical protein
LAAAITASNVACSATNIQRNIDIDHCTPLSCADCAYKTHSSCYLQFSEDPKISLLEEASAVNSGCSTPHMLFSESLNLPCNCALMRHLHEVHC